MPKTLVTGANSFVAAHIIDALVREGHDVTGSVRRESAGEELLASHPEWKNNLTTVTIKDYSHEESWSEIFKTHKFDHV
jgi:nucleoside-diphosphate-sugar epimerase